MTRLSDRREAEALALWRAEGKAPAGVCPHCGSGVSVVQRDERFRARCSHRSCGASGPRHYRLTGAVDAFCRPPAYVLRHMGAQASGVVAELGLLEAERAELLDAVERLRALVAHPSSLSDVATALKAERDALRAEVERLRAKVSDMRDERLRIEAERDELRAEVERLHQVVSFGPMPVFASRKEP